MYVVASLFMKVLFIHSFSSTMVLTVLSSSCPSAHYLSPLSMSADSLYYMEVYLKNVGPVGFVSVKVRREVLCVDLLNEMGSLKCVPVCVYHEGGELLTMCHSWVVLTQ